MQDNTSKYSGWFHRYFKDHPGRVGECYFRHLGYSLKTGGQMVFYAFCLVLHGLLPFLCERTASDYVCRLYADMQARRQKSRCDEQDDV